MPDDTDLLQRQILTLQEEKRQLQSACAQLEKMQTILEDAICEGNAKLLQAEMTGMELEQVFAACTDAMWVVREDGIVVRANEAMLQIVGKPAAQLIGRECSTLLDYFLCRGEECPLKQLSSRDRAEYDIQLAGTANTTEDFILSTAALTNLDGSRGLFCQFKNITARKVAEKELAAANEALTRMSMIDGLTQIANRRCFDETLNKEWLRLKRNQLPLSLLMGDIDFFKKYNDHYGHQGGDECLRQIAQVLARSVMRPADLVARYGGEEFVVLLPEIDIQGAICVGNRILAAIEGVAIEHQLSTVSKTVTMSMGAATLVPKAGQDGAGLIALADEALYLSKNGGRNRITLNPQCRP